MNIWSDIKGIEHTVVSWLAKEYAKFYKAEPTIDSIVDSTVKYVEIGLPIVLDVTGEAVLDPAIEAVLNEVVSDLKVVSATVYDFGPSPSAATILSSVQANLSGLETAGHVKDPAKVAKLTLIVNAVGALAAVIVKAIAAAEAPAEAPAA
jgi:hypothetical protein